MTDELRIRRAERRDVPLLFSLIHELAEYEREPQAVTCSEELLATALFGEHPSAEALVGEVDGEPS